MCIVNDVPLVHSAQRFVSRYYTTRPNTHRSTDTSLPNRSPLSSSEDHDPPILKPTQTGPTHTHTHTRTRPIPESPPYTHTHHTSKILPVVSTDSAWVPSCAAVCLGIRGRDDGVPRGFRRDLFVCEPSCVGRLVGDVWQGTCHCTTPFAFVLDDEKNVG